MEPADAVLRFLESMGKGSEAEFYLALFRAEAKERFAAISVDANVARHASEAVVLDLRFLARLGLSPVVVLGLFEPTDAVEHGSRIRRRLEKGGVPAVMVPPSDPQLGDTVASAARAGTLPIVAFGLPEGATTEDRFTSLGQLLSTLKTRKLIFLNRRGSLRQRGASVSLVNLTTEYETFASSKELSRKQQLILSQARRLVFELLPHKLLVSTTSPLDLLRELFTVKGAGTLLRRGAVVSCKQGFEEVDLARLGALLENSFGRPPVPAFFQSPVSRVYLEENYRGAALLVDTPLGAYLSKFAVDREAQGEGMGTDLWQTFVADYPVVFWRARAHNPIVGWYAKQCDGLMRFPDWHVFWKGLAPDKIPDALAYALAAPVDMAENGAG
jgi:acetylglutamate kinase